MLSEAYEPVSWKGSHKVCQRWDLKKGLLNFIVLTTQFSCLFPVYITAPNEIPNLEEEGMTELLSLSLSLPLSLPFIIIIIIIIITTRTPPN